MNASELAAFKRAVQALGLQNKMHLSRTEVDRVCEYLNQDRYYQVSDRLRAMDPAAIAQLLR